MSQENGHVTIDTDAILDEMAERHQREDQWGDALAIAQRRTRKRFNGDEFTTRLDSAIELVENDMISFDGSGRMWVTSQTDPDQQYLVDQRPCRCVDSKHRHAPGGYCKHRLAAYMFALTQQIVDQQEDGFDSHAQLSPTPGPMEYHLSNPPARATMKYRDIYGVEVLITIEDMDDDALVKRMKRYQKYVYPQVRKAQQAGIVQPGQERPRGNSSRGQSGPKPWCAQHKSPFFDNGDRGWGHKIKNTNKYCQATPEQVARFTKAS